MADLNYWAGDPFDTQLNQLKSALSTNEALITLTGEAGVGKSALCHEFQAIAQANGDFVIYLADPPSTIKDLQQAFKSRQPQLDQYSFMTALERWLVELSQQGHKAVLVIDNAHLLNVEVSTAVRLISNLQTQTCQLIQVLLCAQPQMFKVMGQPQYGGLLQRVSHRLELLPLTKAQLHQLVNDCYSVHLAPAALSLMYKLSQGKPGIAVSMAQMLGQQSSANQSGTGELSKSQFGRAIADNVQFRRLLNRHRLSQSILPIGILAAATIGLYLYVYSEPLNAEPTVLTDKVHTAKVDTAKVLTAKANAEKVAINAPIQVPVQTQIHTPEQQKPITLQTTEEHTALITTPAQEEALEPEIEAEVTEKIKPQQIVKAQEEPQEEQLTTPPPPTKAQIEQAVMQAITQWTTAWQAQDVDGFFSAYATQFTPDDKTSHKQWRKQRMIRIIRPLWITLNVDDIQIMNTSDQRIFSQFWLSYASPNYQDKTLKQLEWTQHDGRWVIATEQNIRLLRP